MYVIAHSSGPPSYLQGWRMVFYIMAGVAGLTTVLLLIFGIEPRNIRVKEGLETEPEKHRVAKLHVLKQALGGVVVRCHHGRETAILRPSLVMFSYPLRTL